ncbi:MAG: hypothetical protein M3394_10590 [Actinomycetota bacterium]|nr:hypothetical protein [Actinomycetota bacterium]
MRRVVGLTLAVLAGFSASATPARASDRSHQQDDWACVYSLEAGMGYCQANPVPVVEAPPEAGVLPEVPDLAPVVEEYVVPLIPAKRF